MSAFWASCSFLISEPFFGFGCWVFFAAMAVALENVPGCAHMQDWRTFPFFLTQEIWKHLEETWRNSRVAANESNGETEQILGECFRYEKPFWADHGSHVRIDLSHRDGSQSFVCFPANLEDSNGNSQQLWHVSAVFAVSWNPFFLYRLRWLHRPQNWPDSLRICCKKVWDANISWRDGGCWKRACVSCKQTETKGKRACVFGKET